MVNSSQKKIRDKLSARLRRRENAELEAQRIKEFDNLEQNNKLLKEKLTTFQSIKIQLDVKLDMLMIECKNNKNALLRDTANGEDKKEGE